MFDTVIRGNASTGFIGVGRLERCVISGNGVWGISGIGPLVVRDCRITDNQSPYDGGGLSLDFPSMFANPKPILLERCLIANNTCQGSGGGVSAIGTLTDIVLSQCEITGNVAGERGGDIYLESMAESPFIQGGSLKVERSLLANNHAGVKGGAIYGGGTPDLLTRRCTVTSNTPDGVFGSQHRDGIYWNQMDPFAGFTTADVDHGVVQGGYPGNNFSFDPLFIDAPNGDFRLRAESPCRDLGGTTIGVDFEGDPLMGPADLGADEFRAHLSLRGGTAPGDIATIELVGEPGASPLLLFVSIALNPTGVSTPYSTFYLGFPLVPGFPIDLGAMPSGSKLAIPVPIPSTIPEGLPVHMQAFIGGSNPTLTNATTIVFG